MFIHPMGCSLGERLVPFYFSNLIGNPAETTVALTAAATFLSIAAGSITDGA